MSKLFKTNGRKMFGTFLKKEWKDVRDKSFRKHELPSFRYIESSRYSSDDSCSFEHNVPIILCFGTGNEGGCYIDVFDEITGASFIPNDVTGIPN